MSISCQTPCGRRANLRATAACALAMFAQGIVAVHAGSVFTYDPPGNLTTVTQAVAAPPAIVAQPVDQVVSHDGNVYFSVAAAGTGPLSYQWLSNGIPIAGATGDSLVVPGVAVPSDLISNGGFENPFIAGANFQTFNIGAGVDGWTIESGSVDLVVSSFLQSAQGGQSLDLNGTVPGTIFQEVPTVSGQSYILHFALAGNLAIAPVIKTNQVWWGTNLLATLTFDTTGHSASDMGWTNREYVVAAVSNSTRVRFVGLNSGSAGSELDAVSLWPVPPAPVNYSVIVSNSSGSATSTVAKIEFDTDDNGLPDSWERAWFGIIGQIADADSDGDGVSNGDEYLDGTDPTNSGSFRPRLNLLATPGGSVSESPFQSSYALNDVVQIVATPDAGNFFLGWSGITNTNATVIVTMDATKTITAIFGLGLISGGNGDGTIAPNGTNIFAFMANAGENVIVRVGEFSGTAAFDPMIRLYNPAGVLVGSQLGAAAAEIVVALTNSGLFTVTVTDGPTSGTAGTGAYRLHFVKLPGAFVVPAGDEGGTLTNGDNGTGAIDVGDLDLWSFTANAGDRILLRIGEITDDNADFDPWIRLYSPAGVLLGTQSATGAAEIAVTATNSGTFTVVVSDANNSFPNLISDTGTYQLHLAKFPGAFVVAAGDEGGPLANGDNGVGTVDTGDLDLWSFTATNGDSIVVRVGETSDDNGGFDPWIRLYSPAGVLLGSQSGTGAAEIAVTATNSGTFTVVVSDANNSFPNLISDTGTYRVRLAKSPGVFVVPGGDEGGPLANGGVGAGTIETGDLDVWSFTADAGDSLIVRVGETADDNGDFDPWIRLYGPSGALLGSQSGSGAAEIAVTATNTGAFTVIVSDANISFPNLISDTGAYRVYLAKAPGAFVVSDDGATMVPPGIYSGTNDVGDLDLWGFWANKGDTVTVQIDELSDPTAKYDPWIRLYSPKGTLLNSAPGATTAQFSRLITNTGPYLIVVSDAAITFPNYLSDAGTYRLTLSGMTGPPRFTSIQLAGSQLVLSGSGGPTNAPYVVLSATNMAIPLPLWTPLRTNIFSPLGAFSFTNLFDPAQHEQYFRLSVP